MQGASVQELAGSAFRASVIQGKTNGLRPKWGRPQSEAPGGRSPRLLVPPEHVSAGTVKVTAGLSFPAGLREGAGARSKWLGWKDRRGFAASRSRSGRMGDCSPPQASRSRPDSPALAPSGGSPGRNPGLGRLESFRVQMTCCTLLGEPSGPAGGMRSAVGE